jgi:hypothetical protein
MSFIDGMLVGLMSAFINEASEWAALYKFRLRPKCVRGSNSSAMRVARCR